VTFSCLGKSSLVQQVIWTESKTHKAVSTMKGWNTLFGNLIILTR